MATVVPRAILVAGLGYGDEGKGTTVDWLCREHNAKLVVRHNGGSQAAHNVVLDDGKHHCFSQFGAGALAGVPTLLSRHMLVNPITWLREAMSLSLNHGVSPLVVVEREAIITTPYHVFANRRREEARGDGRHGSCGMGIGETRAHAIAHPDEAIRAGDLRLPRAELRQKLVRIQERLEAEVPGGRNPRPDDELLDRYQYFNPELVDREWLPDFMKTVGGVTVFEGAQGVLLDEAFGFQPYTTWTDCTFGGAASLLAGADIEVTRLGVIRSYMTRHGAGPLVTENADLASYAKQDHNVYTPWQHSLRVGALDLPALRYALRIIGGVDGLVVTHMDVVDRLSPGLAPVCVGYRSGELPVRKPEDYEYQTALARGLLTTEPIYQGIERAGFAEAVAKSLEVPLYATSHGPRPRDKRSTVQRAARS